MAFRVLVGGAAVLAFPVVNGLAQSVDPALLNAITVRVYGWRPCRGKRLTTTGC